METNIKRIGLINGIVLLVAAAGLAALSQLVVSSAAIMAGVLATTGLLVALLSFFQMGLEERERFEKLELDELKKSAGSASIFETTQGDAFPAQRSREMFEKYFVPAFTTLLCLAEGFAAWWPWRWLATRPHLESSRALLAAALLAICFLILFMLGKYSSGLARLQSQRLLRPGASFLLLNAYACLITAVTILVATYGGFPNADLWVGRVFCVVVGLISAETLVSLVLEIYRVRVRGREVRVLYESRLVGLLGRPEGIITTLAHSLDYQFGFKVSDTSFYRFLEKWISALVLAQLVLLLLSTCLVFINPGEEALLERFGAPVPGREVIGPGLHFKLPWPMDEARRYQTEQVQSFVVGVTGEEENGSTIQWGVAHGQEDDILVASHELIDTNLPGEKRIPPVSLISVEIPVQFQITNLVAWAYTNEAPDDLIKALAARETDLYLASADLGDLMTRGREAAGRALRERIQAAADQKRLGARVLFAGFQEIHPPVKVAADYEKVVASHQLAEALLIQARTYALVSEELSSAEATNRVLQADAERTRSIYAGRAMAVLFTNQAIAYAAAPGIYTNRMYLKTLAEVTANARKYVLAITNSRDVNIIYDNSDKLNFDPLLKAATSGSGH